MFHVDVTFEDTRVIAVEASGADDLMMSVDFHHTPTGHRVVKLMTLAGLMRVLSVGASGSREATVSTTYQEAKEILGDGFTGGYAQCRPIP